MRQAAYHTMTLAEKQATAREQWREAPLRCVVCGAGVMAADMLSHLDERCERPPVHPHARWLDTRATTRLVSSATLVRWVRKGEVRARGPRHRREYLERDLVAAVAVRKRLARRW